MTFLGGSTLTLPSGGRPRGDLSDPIYPYSFILYTSVLNVGEASRAEPS